MKTAPEARRLVIVDDNRGFRLAAQRFLEFVDGVAVAGSAADGFEGLEIVARVRPDAVLVDIHMPGMTGFEFVAKLNAMPDPPPAILVSMHVDEHARREAKRLGVGAVLAKEDFVEGLSAALAQAFAARKRRDSDSGDTKK